MAKEDETIQEEVHGDQPVQAAAETAETSEGDSTMVLNDQEELPSVEAAPFQNMENEEVPGNSVNSLEILFDLELPVSVELARKNVLISDILQLGEGSILEFDKMAGEPVDLLVNSKKIAEGEVVVIDDRFGIRITNLLDPSERVKGLQ
ncbi:MAG: flagellar motor switch protein FliN [Calditrichaeota bacterium]|nr:flagellar motor switch protein FliN [Calditrichota bacterium]